jgi:methylthioribose-1-phosphate isomerase
MNYYLKIVSMPFVALAFLMFLPAIGFVLVAQALVQKIVNVIKVVTVQPSPAIGVAHATGAEPKSVPTDELEELAKEVEAKRQSSKNETR